MKGFKLTLNAKQLSGAIEEGITGVLIVIKSGKCNLVFSSLNQDGNKSYVWHRTDLNIGDLLDISLEDIADVSRAQEIQEYNISREESERCRLEAYYKLRQELVEEGLI